MNKMFNSPTGLLVNPNFSFLFMADPKYTDSVDLSTLIHNRPIFRKREIQLWKIAQEVNECLTRLFRRSILITGPHYGFHVVSQQRPLPVVCAVDFIYIQDYRFQSPPPFDYPGHTMRPELDSFARSVPGCLWDAARS